MSIKLNMRTLDFKLGLSTQILIYFTTLKHVAGITLTHALAIYSCGTINT